MASIKIDSASKKVLVKIGRIDKSLNTQLRNSWYQSGKLLKATASRNILKKPKSGKTYVLRDRAGRRRRHVASAPGESWANLSGTARKGLFFKVVSAKKMKFGNKDVYYARFLEDGTKKMDARPAHLISIKQNKKNIFRILRKNTRKAF